MGIIERRQRERQLRRDAVLRAARQVLLEKGIRGTTSKEIAGCCELSEASLFFYFKNKDEILGSLLFESIEFWSQNLARIESLKLPPERRLDEIWHFHERVHEEHPEYYVLSAYLAQPEILENISPEVREEIARKSGENFRQLSRLLGPKKGRSDTGRIMADAIWALFLGLTVLRGTRIQLGHSEVRTGVQDRAAVFAMLKSGLLKHYRRERGPA